MVDIIVSSHAVEILAVLVFVGWGMFVCLFGLLYKSQHTQIVELHYWVAWCAWVLPHILFSVLASLLWIQIYEYYHPIDATPYIFALLILYILLLSCWFGCTYILPCPTFHPLAYIAAILATASAIITIVLIFVTISPTLWFHWISVVLLLPVVCAIWCTYNHYSVVTEHHHPHHSTEHHHNHHDDTNKTQKAPRMHAFVNHHPTNNNYYRS